MRLEQTEPAAVGLDSERLEAARALLKKGLDLGEYTCAVYLIGRKGKVAACGSLGRLGDETSAEATLDSIFDMASVTKPVATATSLMILLERGALHLNQPVTDFFPGERLPHLAGVTVKQLVTHTSGLPAWRDLFSEDGTREGAIERLLHTPLENPPGTKHVYSCLGYITLGLIIEKVSGMSLADFARENIFVPLGMDDSQFNPPAEKYARIAWTANARGRERPIVGEVHDENCHAMGGNAGNAGLFSTAPDLALYAQCLLNGGKFESTRILSPLSVIKMLTNQINQSIGGQSYGFFTPPNDMLPGGDLFSHRCAGHTGFTGTSLLIDPEYEIFVILLTNRVYKKREAPDFLRRRRWFHNIVASAITG